MNIFSIVTTYFQHRRLHQTTWHSPDGVTLHQINHILTDVRYATDIMDIRSVRGANIDSGQYLVAVKLRARETNERYIQFVTSELQSSEDYNNIEDQWDNVRIYLSGWAQQS